MRFPPFSITSVIWRRRQRQTMPRKIFDRPAGVVASITLVLPDSIYEYRNTDNAG